MLSGQLEVLSKRRPIQAVIDDPGTDATVRHKLKTVLEMRAFAVNELGLPDGRSFRSYADLHRKYVMWTVYATPEFSLTPRQWCYPFVGCISYRGYFDETRAYEKAQQLRNQGWDVYVAVSPAYSTLGWFDDPIYNTLLQYSEAETAGILFHELAHERVYVEDDTVFNESFAMTVQLEGARRWLARHPRSGSYAEYVSDEQRHTEFVDFVLGYRQRLEVLYASARGATEVRAAKHRIFSRLRRDYDRLKQRWGGFDGYDGWIEEGLNNALFAPFGTYHDLVPAFRRLLAREQGKMRAFYRAVDGIAALPPEQRHRRLQTLMAQSDD
jgi:predicted aminopeptidase